MHKQENNCFPARKRLVKQCDRCYFFTSDDDLKIKNSRTAAQFWPQRDLSVVGSRVDASGQRSIERYLHDSMFFFCCCWARIIHVNVQCLPSRKKKEMLKYCRSPERGTSGSRKLSSSPSRITFFSFSKDQYLAL